MGEFFLYQSMNYITGFGHHQYVSNFHVNKAKIIDGFSTEIEVRLWLQQLWI